ncbi:MAG: pyridoxal 5'-phosphate synthase glutaminase subunit PdxT [Bacillota bacterium]|nr:pyridoxal 5'-phosphate synthase glutaminase subunit PdxT [Bacillota bacterium]MDI7250243.1 pyridoxal 5'-phosphate synthase glutaminase subunit PdxT [Bacillota bacterium]
MKIGVLDLQGAVIEHVRALEAAGAEAVRVKKLAHLAGLEGLIIPGGESTTIGRLMEEYGFLDALRAMGRDGFPMFGTCAGMIMLARDIAGSDQSRLGLMDIAVQRNGFGRQRDSFEIDLDISALGNGPFRAVFIRAPYVSAVGPGVEVMAALGDRIVLCRQGNLLASAFHPELTPDTRLHRYFLSFVSRGTG